MSATIKIKNSSTTGAVPTSSDLVQGELAVNVTDLGLYTENASGTVVKLNAPSIDDKNTGATKRMTIDTSGNIGVGVTPSAWVSGDTVLQIKAGSGSGSFWGRSNSLRVVGNTYYNGTNYKYIDSDYASFFTVNPGSVGGFNWNVAASGTAGNNVTTFTQAMTLDASGNLGIGTTSPSYRLDVAKAGAGVTARIQNSSNSIGTYFYNDTANAYIASEAAINNGMLMNTGSGYVAFVTGTGTERARIDSSGNLLVATTGATGAQGFAVLPYAGGSYTRTGHTTSASSGDAYAQFYYNGGSIGSISQNGTTGVLYNLTSDYRLKNNPVPLTGGKQFIMALQPKTWDWWDGSGKGVGFVAHEFMEVAKHSGQGAKDAVDEDGNPVYQSIQPSSSEVMANLVAHIQELETRLAALENK